MSTVAQTWTIIGAVAALLTIVVGIQSFWIVRTLDRIDKRLDRIEDTFLRDHGERLARLEATR